MKLRKRRKIAKLVRNWNFPLFLWQHQHQKPMCLLTEYYFKAGGNRDYSGLHQLLAWPKAFGTVLQGRRLAEGPTGEHPWPHRAVLQRAPGVEIGAGDSARRLEPRKRTIRLSITHLSASQKAIGIHFFFSKNLPFCIAHIQLTIRCYADKCPKYQSSQMLARALGKPYGLRTICILSWMCFNFNPTGICYVFTIF